MAHIIRNIRRNYYRNDGIYVSVPLPTITNFSVTGFNVTTDDIDLAWDSDPETDTWDVHYKLTSEPTTWTLAEAGITATSKIISGLIAGENYNLRLTANNTSGSVQEQLEEQCLPDPPNDLAAINVDTTTLDLTWSAALGASGYDIEYKESASGTWINMVGSHSSSPKNVTGLTEDTSYDFRIRSNGTARPTLNSEWSDTFTVQTAINPPDQVTATNLTFVPSTESVSCSWTATARATSYDLEWRLNPSGGITTINGVTSSYNLTGLDDETIYDIRINAVNSGGTTVGEWDTVTTQQSVPTAPTGLQLTNITTNSLRVSWVASNEEPDWYDVWMRDITGAGSWTEITTGVTDLFYDVTGLSDYNEYEFYVVAENEAGHSTNSGTVSTYTDAIPPATPVITEQSQNTTTNGIAIQWDSDPNTDTWDIYYKLSSSGTWINHLSGYMSTSRELGGLSAGDTYDFRVDANGPQETVVGYLYNVVLRPDAPTGISISNVSQTTLDLSWTEANGSIDVRIQQNKNSEGWLDLVQNVTGTSYSVSGLDPDTSYEYRLFSRNSAGDSEVSGTVSTTTLQAPPDQVTATNLTFTPSTESVSCSWTGVARATSYNLEWRLSPSGGITEITGVTSSHNITGLDDETAYDVRINAVNNGGTTVGEWDTVTTQQSVPTAPTNVQLTNITSDSMRVTWDAALEEPDTYNVWQRDATGGGSWVEAVTGVTDLFWDATGLSGDNTYEFYVVAVNEAGQSTNSSTVSNTTLSAPPQAPTNLSSSNVEKTNFDLSWQSGGGVVTHYSVEQADGGQTNWTEIIASTTNLTENISGLTQNTSYDFRVIAHNSGGSSSPSATLNVVTADVFTLIPNSDIDVGDWSTPPLFSKVNDGLIVTDIQSSNGNSYCTIGFETAANTGTGGTLYFSISRTSGNNGLSYGIELYKNGGLIQSVSYTEATVPLTTTEFTMAFSTTIAPGDTFSVQLGRTGGGNPSQRAQANCSEMRIEF